MRSGGWLDPDLCNIFLEISADDGFWEIVQSRELADALFAMEPALQTLYVDTDYLDDITRAFGQVIDAKSPFTGGHSARVGRYVDLVARQMGIDENSRRDLYRAAVLHDVGKLAVSSAILEKPGPLSEAEWVIMRSHSTHSFQILSRIKPMETVAVTAAAHHERLDGKGYPLGIDDSEIPLGARIITICDIYDALTADRPYRAAMSQEKAMAILHSDCNTAVDPHCLAALEVVLSARQ
ncbi:MAG: HD-GYP domain-containing protein [Parasphingorhabdus sp.]|nr:HD-GYP domain-containing protein [Parasphingorhabdus sp.]